MIGMCASFSHHSLAFIVPGSSFENIGNWLSRPYYDRISPYLRFVSHLGLVGDSISSSKPQAGPMPDPLQLIALLWKSCTYKLRRTQSPANIIRAVDFLVQRRAATTGHRLGEICHRSTFDRKSEFILSLLRWFCGLLIGLSVGKSLWVCSRRQLAGPHFAGGAVASVSSWSSTVLARTCYIPLLYSNLFHLHLQVCKDTIQWESVPRRPESSESMEPDMVRRSVRSSRRWRCLNTRHTAAFSAERTLSSALALESGVAVLAEKLLLEEPTRSLLPVVWLFEVPLDVCEDWHKSLLKL